MTLHGYKYQLSFKTPLKNSKGIFKNHKGVILEYVSDKITCFSEAAPLPGYSRESINEVEQFLLKNRDKITSILDAENSVQRLEKFYKISGDIPASIKFALDSLSNEITALHRQKSLKKLLFPDAPDQIPVNALVSLHSDHFLETIKDRVSEGFQTIKFKVGIDFEHEFKQLKKIRDEYPALNIRLDANQAWKLKDALIYCPKLASLNVEYCEEPLQEITPENFEVLSQHTDLPLALDESIISTDFWPNLLPFTSFIILKPMLIGSFTTIFETKRLADTHDNKTVFTTSFESGIGRKIIATLALGWGAKDTAHGLATGSLLSQDVHSDFTYITNGFFNIESPKHSSGVTTRQIKKVSKSIF